MFSQKKMMFNTFGVAKSKEKISEQTNKVFEINALCIGVICSPQPNQLIDYLREKFEHLTGLDFADDGSHVNKIIDLLIGYLLVSY